MREKGFLSRYALLILSIIRGGGDFNNISNILLPPPPALVGMLHVGVFILLLLSGERNFGVRLNKPYVHRITLPDIPKFSGTHADLLFLVCLHDGLRVLGGGVIFEGC